MNSYSHSLVFMLITLLASRVEAAETMLKACTSEIKKFSCDAKSESYAYDCLRKHEEHRTKNHGFSGSCYKAYAAFEKATGKGDKVESHQVENPEHSN